MAFSLMLTGVALEYYFNHVKNNGLGFDEMVAKIKNRFDTEERTLAMTQEWDAISLISYIKDNPSKSKKESLDLMIARLQELQLCLPNDYRSDVLLKNKLLSACDGVEECRLARQKVAPTVEGVIADLHTSISTSASSSISNLGDTRAFLTALYTERKKMCPKQNLALFVRKLDVGHLITLRRRNSRHSAKTNASMPISRTLC